MKSLLFSSDTDEPEDQREGKCVTSGCHAGKVLSFVLLSLYGLSLIIYTSIMIYKLKKYHALRRVINFYMYIGIYLILGVRIASVLWLILYDDLHSYIEVVSISSFLLCNTATLIIWARKCVLFRFEESSEYYSKIKCFSHIFAAGMVALVAISQSLGIILDIHTYINTSLEVIFVVINLYLTWKIVKYFTIFDFNETKAICKWVLILTASILTSYIARICINIFGFVTNYNLLVTGVNLNGKSKMVHFSIIILIEYIPILVWILYIFFTKGEIERTLSVSVKSYERSYAYQKLEIGGTVSGNSSGSRNTKFSEILEGF
ncbi:unnamed protein product [Moneuplotes crassus]|uniref:THH1/TOM1/TOM3 domain-containing protein n=1 Tax=Euplotes crassus TaxID=5936 RepID=A0AAD2CXP4_EUPCR|nr:unnamed protein product [Moneuplotes crassus]